MHITKPSVAALSALAMSVALSAPASPASADLPSLHCESDFGVASDLIWCMSYQNNFVTVSVANKRSTENKPYFPFYLELAYYPYQTSDGGKARTLVPGVLVDNFWPYPYGVAKTEPLWTITAGYYCVRWYRPGNGQWEDTFCFSDTGRYWGGNVGAPRW